MPNGFENKFSLIFIKYNENLKTNFTEIQFNSANGKDYLKLICYNCNNSFLKKKKQIISIINKVKTTDVGKYCSFKCQGIHQKGHQKSEVECKNCNKKFIKFHGEIKKYPNHFCSRSCAATYNNTHKTKGTRVSKLELWLQKELKILYPKIDFDFNGKKAINSELDIYIPGLKLAFELNGIFHYEPIYGEEKLCQIQNNDNRKFQACLEKNIELVIMDVSSVKYFKPERGKKYLDIIVSIINTKV